MLSRIVIALGVGDDDNRDQPFATSYRIKRNIRQVALLLVRQHGISLRMQAWFLVQ